MLLSSLRKMHQIKKIILHNNKNNLNNKYVFFSTNEFASGIGVFTSFSSFRNYQCLKCAYVSVGGEVLLMWLDVKWLHDRTKQLLSLKSVIIFFWKYIIFIKDRATY